MAKTTNEKLAQAQLEKEQAEARIKSLLKEQKEEERKARNHRFCKRGGFMEKLLPDLAKLTDEQFEAFFKRTTANNYGRKALAELVPLLPDQTTEPEGGADTAQDGGEAALIPAKTATHTEPNPAPKPAQMAKPQGVADVYGTEDAARVAS